MPLYLTRFSTSATWAKLIKNPEDRREEPNNTSSPSAGNCTDSGTLSVTTTDTICGRLPTTSRWQPRRSQLAPAERSALSRRPSC